MNAKHTFFQLSLLGALALAACGGGGDAGSSGGTSTGSTPGATVNPQQSDTTTATLVGRRRELSADPTVRTGQIKADVRASTVYIETDGTTVVPTGLTGVATSSGARGSGFIMTNEGHIITNAHVAKGQGIYMVTIEGRPRPVNAELVAIAECEDLAVLRLVSGAPYPPLSWLGEPPRISMKIGVAGYPADVSSASNSAPYTFTEGTINTDVLFENNYWSSADMFYHSATAYGGNSGGPVVELDTGTVVGVHYSGGNGRQMALSSTTSRDIIDKLLAGKDVLSIGFSGEMFYKYLDASGNVIGYGLREQITDQVKGLAPAGVWVRGVAAGGKAKRAGVLPGDVITAIAGVRLDQQDNTMGTYCSAMRSNNPNTGHVVDIEIARPKAGGVVCAGEINGRVMGIKGAPSTSCPEAAQSPNGQYSGQAGTDGSLFNHTLTLTIKNGAITGTGSWSDGTMSISGTIDSKGNVSMTETIVYQNQRFAMEYTGRFNPATRVISGRVTLGTTSENWSVGGL